MPKLKCKNVVICLLNREYRQKPHARYDYMILRTLICEGNYVYKKVFEKQSNKSISCEGGKIYFSNYSSCYGGYTLDGTPKHLYKLGIPTGVKIEDAIIVNAQPECIPLPYQGHLKSMICLTNKNNLIRYDLSTGRILQEVFLSPRCTFRNIAWNNYSESFVIKSTHNKMSNLARQAGIPISIMMVLAVFTVYPLEFKAMMEVSKDIFGKDVIDSTVSQGLFITMHQSNYVRMYSFEYILEKYRTTTPQLYEEIDDLGHVCGHQPVGVPCNVHISECPPVLFEVKCADHIVEIGGIPWHYLICPPKCRGCFNVISLESNTLADNGILEADNISIEPDKAVFSPDESGRILHIGASEIRILKICEGNNGGSVIRKSFTINMDKRSEKDEHIPVTSSGRSIKRRISVDEVMECANLTIHNVDYETDLDLLCVSAVYHEPESTSGVLCLHDNNSCHLYKEIKLEEPYLELYEHNVYLDLDTIIQIIKPSQSKFCCIVYKLCAIDFEETESDNIKINQKHQESCTVSTRTRYRQARR